MFNAASGSSPAGGRGRLMDGCGPIGRYRRDIPVVVPSRELLPACAPFVGPGIPMQVVVPSVSLAAVLQGTALTTFVEIPSGPTLSKPGPGYTSGTGPPNALSGASGP